MAIPAILNIAKEGTTPIYGTPAASQDIACGDGVFLHVKNANASACVITLTDPGHTTYGSAATNPTNSVAANTGDEMFPVPRSLAGSNGLVTAAFSVTSSVSVALLRLPAVV